MFLSPSFRYMLSKHRKSTVVTLTSSVPHFKYRYGHNTSQISHKELSNRYQVLFSNANAYFFSPGFFSPGSRGFGSEENLLQFLACQNISSRSLLQIHYKHQTNLQILLKLQGPCNHLLNIWRIAFCLCGQYSRNCITQKISAFVTFSSEIWNTGGFWLGIAWAKECRKL